MNSYNDINKSKIIKFLTKRVPSYLLDLKNKDAHNNDHHSKENNDDKNDKKSSHESVTSTHFEFNNNNETHKSKKIRLPQKVYPLNCRI